MRRLGGTNVLAVLALPATLVAQAPLVGTVTDASSGRPIGSVELTIERWGLKTTTDSAGHYRMVVPGGVYQLRARKIGYQPESRVLSVVVADTIHLDLTLTIAPVQLPELTAKAAWDTRYRSEFAQRVKEGFGRFLTPPDLNEWPVEEIEGVEVYVGPIETPAEYNLTGSDCGVLLIWTRTH
jgi:Carboxypeptidase regulatory-like domain